MGQPNLTVELLRNRYDLASFILALARNEVVAEDIFQEVAVVILNEAAAGKKVHSFMPWAREVARRRVAEHFRKSSKNRQLLSLNDSMVEVVCRAFAENEEPGERSILRLRYLRECLERLTPRAREAIKRRYEVPRGIEEIASAMKVQVATMNVMLSKARKALADCVRIKLSTLGESQDG